MEETRNIRIGDKYYTIPSLLSLLCINGEPFAHFIDGNITFDEEIMDTYSIDVEVMPYYCPEWLNEYIKKNFKEHILD